jgi:hypothetical protein
MPNDATPPAIPPGLAIYQMAIGHYLSRALYVAAKLQIADLLKDSALDHETLAAKSQTHAPSLRRLLRLLASAGVLNESNSGLFSLSPLGQTLRTDLPGSMHWVVLLFAGYVPESWKDLEFCVRTGQPAFKRANPNATPFTAIADDPEAAATFDKAMATFAPNTAAAISQAYNFSQFNLLADLGGGNASLLLGILAANPTLNGIVFDLPHVEKQARQNIANANLESRCNFIPGDFFKNVPIDADAYLLKHVIHDWNDEQAAAILKNVRAATKPNAKLLIIEGLYPNHIDDSPTSRAATANDVNMLVCTGGRQRSESEFKNLFNATGFQLTQIVPTIARVLVIEAQPLTL